MLPAEPAVCRIDAKGRIVLTGLEGILGWAPGDLDATPDGDWVLLAPAGRLTARRQVPTTTAPRWSGPTG